MYRSGVFHYHHVLALDARKAQFSDGFGAVRQQPRLIRRIRPGFRHYLCAIARPDLMLIGVNQLIERRQIDHTFL